ncbi:MAG: hypothetical protein IT353_21205 [Gemmatimonadaceae bacterium]|nr:hypothetical protein [Gemmatimonadaceae bacterium]
MSTATFRTLLAVCLCAPSVALAQVRVSPSSVNVNAQGATTAIITFSGVGAYSMGEALFCGALVSAAPAGGSRCAPGTIFGQLPARYERTGGNTFDAVTDVMTVPVSVARRAYQDAASGNNSAFYYVRRFRSDEGVDEYAAVTLRLSNGGARTPLSLTDVRLAFVPEAPVLYVANGDVPSDVEAVVRYTGSGRLTGRWEIVYPGEQVPTTQDLLTEAAHDPSTGAQRRYTQLARFNVFLPPTGRAVIPGPDASRLPTASDGMYYLLFRVESAFDAESPAESSSSLDGEFIINNSGLAGAGAGFTLPMLRYVVGSGSSRRVSAKANGSIRLRLPARNATVNADALQFVWDKLERASQYRLEVGTTDGTRVFAAMIPGTMRRYEAPPLLKEKAPQGAARWRVVGLDSKGREVGRSVWSPLTFAADGR